MNGPVKDETNVKIALQRLTSLYLLSNTPKGRGVFASQPIPRGTIIDTCPVLVLAPQENQDHIEKTSLYHYTYNWPVLPSRDTSTRTEQDRHANGGAAKPPTKTQAVILGLGSMFNHSTQNQNVVWTRDLGNQVVVYRALRDIATDEELCISYGDHLTFVDADKIEGEEEREEDMLGRIGLG